MPYNYSPKSKPECNDKYMKFIYPKKYMKLNDKYMKLFCAFCLGNTNLLNFFNYETNWKLFNWHNLCFLVR